MTDVLKTTVDAVLPPETGIEAMTDGKNEVAIDRITATLTKATNVVK
jgi:hypothetical protein